MGAHLGFHKFLTVHTFAHKPNPNPGLESRIKSSPGRAQYQWEARTRGWDVMRIDYRDPQKALWILEMRMIYNETLKENFRCLKSPKQVHVALFSLSLSKLLHSHYSVRPSKSQWPLNLSAPYLTHICPKTLSIPQSLLSPFWIQIFAKLITLLSNYPLPCKWKLFPF